MYVKVVEVNQTTLVTSQSQKYEGGVPLKVVLCEVVEEDTKIIVVDPTSNLLFLNRRLK